jgi:hypothetical protein
MQMLTDRYCTDYSSDQYQPCGNLEYDSNYLRSFKALAACC